MKLRNVVNISVNLLYKNLGREVRLLYDYPANDQFLNRRILKLRIGKERVMEIPDVDFMSLRIMMTLEGTASQKGGNESWSALFSTQRVLSYENPVVSNDGVLDMEAYLLSKGWKVEQLEPSEYASAVEIIRNTQLCLQEGNLGQQLSYLVRYMGLYVTRNKILVMLPKSLMIGNRKVHRVQTFPASDSLTIFEDLWLRENDENAAKKFVLTIQHWIRYMDSSSILFEHGYISVEANGQYLIAGSLLNEYSNITLNFDFSDGNYQLTLLNVNAKDEVLLSCLYCITQCRSVEECKKMEERYDNYLMKARMLGTA